MLPISTSGAFANVESLFPIIIQPDDRIRRWAQTTQMMPKAPNDNRSPVIWNKGWLLLAGFVGALRQHLPCSASCPGDIRR